jgi:membrane-associated phospholipid phosphatase
MHRNISVGIICIFLLIQSSCAESTIEEIGDILQIGIPMYAAGMAIQEEGWGGISQLGYSVAVTQIATHTLKIVIDEERPNGSDSNSFPSGHTSMAFTGAVFIHKRYGIEKAVVPYTLSSFVGFSRVYTKAHYTHDVIAGALLSGLFVWIFAENKNDIRVNVYPSGIDLSFRF